MAVFQQRMAIADGAGMGPLRRARRRRATSSQRFLDRRALRAPSASRHHARAPRRRCPRRCRSPQAARLSTQEGFGRILNDLARGETRARATASSPPRPTSPSRPISAAGSTAAALFDRRERADVFRDEKVISAQRWQMSPHGQHIELGIAEHNLFLLLAALGLRRRCSARGCCRSARSTTRSSTAASMRSTTPATRMRASCWWRRRPASRWRRKAARTSRSARR